MPLVKPTAPGREAASGADNGLSKSFLTEHCPVLWEHLADGVWADGSPRVTSTLTLFVEAGMVKLCLNDRDGGRTAWASATSWDVAVLTLEERLRDGQIEWRVVGGKGGGKRR